MATIGSTQTQPANRGITRCNRRPQFLVFPYYPAHPSAPLPRLRASIFKVKTISVSIQLRSRRGPYMATIEARSAELVAYVGEPARAAGKG